MTRGRPTLYTLFRNAMLANVKAGRSESFNQFWDNVKDNQHHLRALAEDYFYRQHASWKVEKIGNSYSIVATPATERRAEAAAQRRVESKLSGKKEVARLKNAVRQAILMDVTLPNGKKLRESTFADCKKAGGWLTEVSRHGRATEAVDKKLSEADLQNIWKRYVSGPVSASPSRRAVAAEVRVA